MFDIGRRRFITLLGGAAAWPLAGRAQQPAMPTVGFMSGRSPEDSPHLLSAFQEGLRETGLLRVRALQLNIGGRWVDTSSSRPWLSIS